MNDQGHVMGEELKVLLGKVHPGNPILMGEISIVPLIGDCAGPAADLLEEALEAGTAIVEEVGEAGVVQQVKVSYTGPGVLLLVDGEEIVGAKQNRVLNASFLVPAGPPVIIPVSCVEQGRWRYTSDKFSSSGRTLSSRARSEKLRRVHHSVITSHTYDADQGAVWSDVDGILERTHTCSSSRAYSDAAEARAGSIEVQLDQLTPATDQQGLAVVHGGKVLSMDLFGSPDLYQRAWRKVARGILFEAFEPACQRGDARQSVQEALKVAAGVTLVRTKAPGVGETLHGEGAGIVLGAVAHLGAVYHLELAAAV